MRDETLLGDRMLERISQLAAVTATPGRGVTRLAYSDEDKAGRALVAGWMERAGLEVHEDPATNVIGIRRGRSDRMLATGSHLDTVLEAGHLDGAYGVVAAIEVADVFRRADVALEHTLVVVAFSNEEGARGTPGMTGSHALTGLLKPEWLDGVDQEGITLAARIATAGGDASSVLQPSLDLTLLAGFVELHIEQGPILATSSTEIGAVRAITGRAGIDLQLRGVANHAGTTPMDNRHDALVAAAQVVLAAQDVADEGLVRVATVGVLEVGPGSSNVIPSRATMSIELRDSDDSRLAAGTQELLARIEGIAQRTGTTFSWQPVPGVVAVQIDPMLADCVDRSARTHHLRVETIESGAGHDAQVLAAVAPVAMIFVPSSEGVSHSSREHTSDEHLVAGAEVLAATLLDADGKLASRHAGAAVASDRE
jgi:allantoate deiminase